MEREPHDHLRVQVPLPLPVHLSEASRPSRMLNRYLCDIVEWLRAGEHRRAVRAARLLPQIATALSNSDFQTSREHADAWSAIWLEQEFRSEHLQDADSSPPVSATDALRELRLRRHARPSPLGIRSPQSISGDPVEASQAALCLALIRALSAWYAHEGVRNERVQSNLARLAVLR